MIISWILHICPIGPCGADHYSTLMCLHTSATSRFSPCGQSHAGRGHRQSVARPKEEDVDHRGSLGGGYGTDGGCADGKRYAPDCAEGDMGGLEEGKP